MSALLRNIDWSKSSGASSTTRDSSTATLSHIPRESTSSPSTASAGSSAAAFHSMIQSTSTAKPRKAGPTKGSAKYTTAYALAKEAARRAFQGTRTVKSKQNSAYLAAHRILMSHYFERDDANSLGYAIAEEIAAENDATKETAK